MANAGSTGRTASCLTFRKYLASLVLSDGLPAAVLRLRPMFERFAEEIAAEDEG